MTQLFLAVVGHHRHNGVVGPLWGSEDDAPRASPDGLAAGRTHVRASADDLDPAVEVVPPIGPAHTPRDRIRYPQQRLGALRWFEPVGDISSAQHRRQGLTIPALLGVVDVVKHKPIKTTDNEVADQPLKRESPLVDGAVRPGHHIDGARSAGQIPEGGEEQFLLAVGLLHEVPTAAASPWRQLAELPPNLLHVAVVNSDRSNGVAAVALAFVKVSDACHKSGAAEPNESEFRHPELYEPGVTPFDIDEARSDVAICPDHRESGSGQTATRASTQASERESPSRRVRSAKKR